MEDKIGTKNKGKKKNRKKAMHSLDISQIYQ